MNVKPPARPMNIKKTNMSFEGIDKLEVIPNDKPTVPMAEAVSNRQSLNLNPSIALITMPHRINIPRYIKKMALALRTMLLSIRRFITTVSFFLLNTEIVEKKRTAKVVVFIPPAVEPLDPPMSIRAIIIATAAWLIVCKSTVLKPAVLVVTD